MLRDVVHLYDTDQQPEETVLTLAISRATTPIIKRLIHEGVDVYAKITNTEDPKPKSDVTALHIGNQYCNIEGIRVLLQHTQTMLLRW